MFFNDPFSDFCPPSINEYATTMKINARNNAISRDRAWIDGNGVTELIDASPATGKTMRTLTNLFRCDCQWFVNEESKADRRSGVP